MIRVIPFAVIGIAFLLNKLGDDLEQVAKRAFFFISLLCIPMVFYSCSVIANECGITALETICDWAFILTGIFWLLLFITELWDILMSYLVVGTHG